MSERPTGDLLVLMIAGTICLLLLGGAGAVAVIEVASPEVDTGPIVSNITDVVNTMIGLLAGYLAGRTHAEQRRRGDDRPADP